MLSDPVALFDSDRRIALSDLGSRSEAAKRLTAKSPPPLLGGRVSVVCKCENSKASMTTMCKTGTNFNKCCNTVVDPSNRCTGSLAPSPVKPSPSPVKPWACVCPAVWKPVCAGGNVTLSNQCEAKCLGLVVRLESILFLYLHYSSSSCQNSEAFSNAQSFSGPKRRGV